MAVRGLAETVAETLAEWRANYSFFGPDPMGDQPAEALVQRIVQAVQENGRRAVHHEVARLSEALERAASELAFYQARQSDTQADTLRELQHAYNTISVLVARLGGEVSIPQTELFSVDDSRLEIKEAEDGQVVLRRHF